MTCHISYIFVGEGPSDYNLSAHLTRLCYSLGAEAVVELPIDFGTVGERVGHSLQDKLPVAMRSQPEANLLFIHRDSDSRNPGRRIQEIADAVFRCGCTIPYVAVVPVQSTEAWLLANEDEIKRIACCPGSSANLNVPKLNRIESCADPKERLKQSLIAACELKGRRLRNFKADMSRHHKMLLQGLPIIGPIESLPSWKKMRDELQEAIDLLRS